MTVHLVHLDRSAFEALAAGDAEAAEERVGLPLPPAFVESSDIWRYMLQLLDEPANEPWLMHALVADDTVVGNAGFKGRPIDGQVELGYRILPEHRRRGLATAAATLLVERARLEPGVRRVIARIDPDNAISVRVVTAAGFEPDGEHLHPRWGRQLQLAHDLR